MRKLIVMMAFLAIAAGLALAAGSGEATEAQIEADQAAISAMWAEYGQSRMDANAGRRLALHDPEALKMPQDRPMFRMADVADKLQASWAKQDAATTTEMAVNPEEIVIMGDYAYTMGTYTKKVAPKDGSEPTLFQGKFLTILRKDAEGNWLILRDCYNSSTPPPAKLGQFSFGTPVNLGPNINSEQSEGSPCVSADGLELYFSAGRPDGFGGVDLWVAKRPSVDTEWQEAVNLGPTVNSAANEYTPTISADGLELYFCDYRAVRPGGIGKSDIWVSKRSTRNSEWGEPVNLGSLVNTPDDEITPAISTNGLELYFETDRPGGLGSDDIWVAKRASRSADWGRPIWLGAKVNTEGMEHCPNITSDGLILFFDFTPPGEKQGDLMVTQRASLQDDWSHPVNLGQAMSGHYASSISSDGKMFYFASSYPGGSGGNDIWQVPIRLDGEPVSR